MSDNTEEGSTAAVAAVGKQKNKKSKQNKVSPSFGKTFNPYLTKPARRQAKKGENPRAEFHDHSSEYNIWYHKKLGDRFVKEER
jgi:hypothetical protein